MIELFRTLLFGVTASALCAGIALSFVRGNALREVIRIAGGLAILLSVLQPLSELRLPNFMGTIEKTMADGQGQYAWYQQENERILREAAINQVVTYIEQRASQVGVDCQTVLEAEQDAEGRTLITKAIMNCAPADAHKKQALEDMVTIECGIPKELQVWNWMDGKQK